MDRGTRTLRVTLPRHLARALDYRWRDYLHFALTDDGRGLVIRHFARL